MNMLPFLTSGLGVGAIYALSGVGIVVLYRASGTLNFAFGALGAFGAHVSWSITTAGMTDILGWSVGILSAVFGSVLYGWVIAPRLSHRDRVVRAIGTLGFALSLLGLMGLIWGEFPRRLTLPTDKLYLTIFSVRLTYTRLLAILLTVFMVLSVVALLSRTRIGLQMRALANDRSLSSLIGVDVMRTDLMAWAISGLFAGVAGILLADMVRLQPAYLTFLVIPAIAAALLGSLSSLMLTAVGGISVGVIEALLIMSGPLAPYRTAVPFVLVLVVFALFGSAFAGKQRN